MIRPIFILFGTAAVSGAIWLILAASNSTSAPEPTSLTASRTLPSSSPSGTEVAREITAGKEEDGENAARDTSALETAWDENLRVVGVGVLGGIQTAYFSTPHGSRILVLEVGETLPGGIKLMRIENLTDRLDCRAILSRNGEILVVGTADAHPSHQDATVQKPAGEMVSTAEQPERTTPTIRPWTGKRSW